MDWGNTIISARWNFIFNNKLFSNTTVAFNKYRFYADTYTYSQHTDITTHQATTNKYSADYRSGIQDWSYKMDFDYHPTPAHRIKFWCGISVSQLSSGSHDFQNIRANQ